MSQMLVTIIIPVYKCRAYFHEAVDSALRQTYPNIEIVVVDGLNDTSQSLMASYKSYGDKIRYYHQKPSGVAAARNLGISVARGELVAILDADDIWYPEKLSTQVPALLAFPEAGLTFSGRIVFNANGVVTSSYVHSLGHWFDGHRIGATELAYGSLYRELLRANDIMTSSVVVRKSVLDKVGVFDETFAIAEDYDLWLRIAREYKLLFVNRVLTQYREHPDGLSGPTGIREFRWASASIRVREKHLRNNWIPAECQSLVKRVMAERCWETGVDCFTLNDFKEARTYFRQSLKYRVYDFRTWLYWSASFLPLPVVAIIRRAKRSLRRGVAPRKAATSWGKGRVRRNAFRIA